MHLHQFQQLMDDMYGDVDRARGIPSTVAWLCEEMGELAQAVRKGTPTQQLHELGDVIAWVASLANQLGLSLEDAAQRYVSMADTDRAADPATDEAHAADPAACEAHADVKPDTHPGSGGNTDA